MDHLKDNAPRYRRMVCCSIPFVLYVNYKKWMSYIKGFLLGDKLREEKISKANANQQIKKWLKIPQKKQKRFIL